MTSEKFCLKWNNYQESIACSFQGFREDPDFSDVTLVCEEDHQIEAHRVILTACSPFFSSVLRKNKHSHPMIYMRGLKAKDMTAVVDFIYYGEVNIFQEDLDGFLALAEELKLKGLTATNEETQEIPQLIQKDDTNGSKQIFTNKNKRISEQVSTPCKEEPINENENKLENQADVSFEDRKLVTRIDENMENIAHQIESMIETANGEEFKWRCKVCGKGMNSRKRDMARHVEIHIEGMSYPCNQCGKISRSSHALVVHVSRDHTRT